MNAWLPEWRKEWTKEWIYKRREQHYFWGTGCHEDPLLSPLQWVQLSGLPYFTVSKPPPSELPSPPSTHNSWPHLPKPLSKVKVDLKKKTKHTQIYTYLTWALFLYVNKEKQFIVHRSTIFFLSFILSFFLYLEGKAGRKRGRETLMWEGSIDRLPFVPRMGTKTATQVRTLTRNQTSDISLCRIMPKNSHTGQGWSGISLFLCCGEQDP